GGVDDADHIVRTGAEEPAQRHARRPHQLGQPPAEEIHRLALELELKALVGLEYRPRAGAVRAVIQERHVLAQEEVLGKVRGQLSGLSGWDRAHRAGHRRTAWWRAR